MENFNYPRDLAGYGPNSPNADWPNKAKLVILGSNFDIEEDM